MSGKLYLATVRAEVHLFIMAEADEDEASVKEKALDVFMIMLQEKPPQETLSVVLEEVA